MKHSNHIIYIEASADLCSVCIAEGESIKVLRESKINKSHSELMAPLIDECLKELNLRASDLAAVCIAEGPGSYTSLRITAATAKGLCYGASIPLITIGTLEGLAYGVETSDSDLIIPTIDARRDEIYYQVFDKNRNALSPVSPHILKAHSFSEYSNNKILICGNGALKAEKIIVNPKIRFLQTEFSCLNLIKPGVRKFINQDFTEIFYFNPLYLKPPNITSPRTII